MTKFRGCIFAHGTPERIGFTRMNKPLFTKLIKAWHPDLTTSARRKTVCEEMTRHILSANEADDQETLETIERLGQGYLDVVKEREMQAEEERRSDVHFEEIRRRFYEMQAAESRGEWANAIPIIPPQPNNLSWYLWMINPYLLTFSVRDWRENGRLLNAWALCSAVLWLWIWLHIWNQVDCFEAGSLAAGHTHDGAIGLVFVLVRGALIVVALPVALPFGVFAGGAAVVICTLWFVAWVAGWVLGLFHPWLAFVPHFVAGIVLIAGGWAVLGEDL